MRYFITVSYDGTNYAGWQSQPGKVTIQQEIEKVLKKITKETILIHGSGRTDAKVHALGQVFHFDTSLEMDDEAWVRALNSLLPLDIVAIHAQRVADEAHCRRDAIKKQYEYRMNMGEYNLFMRNFVFQLNKKLNVEKMIEASQYLVGTHDFSSFCANPKEEKENQVRTIYSIDFRLDKDLLTISFKGNGFMRYMIRMLVGGLIEVGKEKITPEHLKEVLDKQDKEACNYNSDPCGLYLVQVEYEG